MHQFLGDYSCEWLSYRGKPISWLYTLKQVKMFKPGISICIWKAIRNPSNGRQEILLLGKKSITSVAGFTCLLVFLLVPCHLLVSGQVTHWFCILFYTSVLGIHLPRTERQREMWERVRPGTLWTENSRDGEGEDGREKRHRKAH